MTDKIILSLSICLISILQSYAAPIHTAAVNGDRAAIAAELQKGVDVNLPIKKPPLKGFTPLYVATQEGLEETVSFLIDNGADVNLRGVKNSTALIFAAENGQLKAT